MSSDKLSKSEVTLALDAMGGDNAPKKIIDGITHNHNNHKKNFYLIFGNENEIYKNIKDKLDKKFFDIIHTNNSVKSTM